jgi:hypothetical protein
MERNNETPDKIQSPEICNPEPTRTIPNHFNQFTTIQNDEIIFDFDRCLAFMEAKGKEQFGDHFRIFPEDHGLIFKLLVYAIHDQENAERLKLNLQKGIMLTGPVGCGKTSLMKLLHFFMPQPETYAIKSCREISFEFIAKGFEVIHKYSTGESRKAYCFDDLGTEQNLKYYGNECNVMAEILLNRYDQFISRGTLSHLTTNLSASEIETFYGNRVRSRMRAMFNLVSFPSGSKDKRK